jgi:hypothetical protein
MINPAPVLSENMIVIFMILPIAANAFPASVPYQKNEQFQER